MRRSIPLALSALSLATSTLLAPAAALASKTAKTAATTYKGAIYTSGNWGDIGVNIQVKGKKLSAIAASVYNDNFQHSLQLDAYAIPILKQEALKSGTYRINAISGATQSSEAFIASLKSALVKAHI